MDNNTYKIYNYIKKNTGITLTIIGGVVAVIVSIGRKEPNIIGLF